MLASNKTALRSFFARFLGWADEHKDAVEHALRSVEFAATHRAALGLLAETDFVPIALAIGAVLAERMPSVLDAVIALLESYHLPSIQRVPSATRSLARSGPVARPRCS